MDYTKLRGSLGLKSSALAPTACKLSSQFIVLDHMSNHYMKIAKAKSAIDSRPPKSMSTSQKMRDRMCRDQTVNSPQPRSRSSVSGVNMYEFEDVLKDEPEDEEEKLVHSIMKSTLLDKSRSSNNATYGSASNMDSYQNGARMSQQAHQMANDPHYTLPYGDVPYNQPASVRSVKSGYSLANSASRLTMPTVLSTKRTCKGDVLEKRPHLFTEPERPFTPRTLKKSTESRLKHSKCYNPPRAKHEVSREMNSEKKSTGSQNHQSPPRTRKHQKVKDNLNNYLQDIRGTSELSESKLMDISLYSRDERYGQDLNHNVPPLAITMDKDHMNWLQEQANKAKIRARSSGRLKSSLHPDEELHPRRKHHSPGESGLKKDIRMEKQKKNEEQKYLAFAKEVTDDVLSRGICTDSVLYRVFENHIERRHADLDENRMRKVISDLRKNLGLKESLAGGQMVASLSDSNYNNKLRKENGTVSSGNNSNSKSVTLKEEYQNLSQTEMRSTMDSSCTYNFGKTGDILSTIHSQASLDISEPEPDGLDNGSEMTGRQTLKQYELILTAKEERGDSSRSTRDIEPSFSRAGRDTVTHSVRHVIEETRHADSDESGMNVTFPQGSNTGSHVVLDDSEDVSLQSQASSQRPTAKPRTRPKQENHETSQGKTNAPTAVVTDEVQGNDVHHSREARHNQKNSPARDELNVSPAADQFDNTIKEVAEVKKQEEHHQQPDEENYEYEDDYEEVIENDGDEDDF